MTLGGSSRGGVGQLGDDRVDRDPALELPEPAQRPGPLGHRLAAAGLDQQRDALDQRGRDRRHLLAAGVGQPQRLVPVAVDVLDPGQLPPGLEAVRRVGEPGVGGGLHRAAEPRLGLRPLGPVLVGAAQEEPGPHLGVDGAGLDRPVDGLEERGAQRVLGTGLLELAQGGDHVGGQLVQVEPLGERERVEAGRPAPRRTCRSRRGSGPGWRAPWPAARRRRRAAGRRPPGPGRAGSSSASR